MIENVIVDIILLIFIAGIVLCIRLVPLREYNQQYLSMDSTTNIRGIMAITIVLHHLSEHTSSGKLFPFLLHMGYLLVAVFFFLSGYGLMSQLKKKGRSYLNGIWKNRILFLTIVLVLDTALYFGVNSLLGNGTDVKAVLLGFVNGHPYAGASWYLIAQILFYILFWISFSVHKNTKLGVYVVAFFMVLYTFALFILKFPEYWIYSNFAFVIGLIWANWKEQIDELLLKKSWLILGIAAIGFAIFSIIPHWISSIYALCRIVSSSFFVIIVVLILRRIRFVNGLWDRVGKISLEVFLLHTLVYRSLRGKVISISSDSLYILLTIFITLLIAIPVYYLNSFIKKRILQAKKRKL